MVDQGMEISCKSFIRKALCLIVMAAFMLTSLVPASYAQAVFNLPQPGEMIGLSGNYTPVVLQGMAIHPEDPLLFDFIVDNGNSDLKGQALTDETTKLVKYFLAGLAVPEKELWVNLSPVEKDRIMADQLSHTDAGRDMLGQDYILKQITSTLMYPEKDLGRKFWDEIYSRVYTKFGNTQVPVDTFNKVWITPDVAEVYQHEGNAFVTKAHLKVMLEADYHAAQGIAAAVTDADNTQTVELARDVVREVILPVLEKEVNEGKNFAPLRQIFHSLILAGWYKNALKNSLLNQVYAGTNKVEGIDIAEKNAKAQVYAQYLQAYQKGVYNYVKEEFDRTTQETLPRKYFSGGLDCAKMMRPIVTRIMRGVKKNLDKYLVVPYKLFLTQVDKVRDQLADNMGQTLVGGITGLSDEAKSDLLVAMGSPLGVTTKLISFRTGFLGYLAWVLGAASLMGEAMFSVGTNIPVPDGAIVASAVLGVGIPIYTSLFLFYESAAKRLLLKGGATRIDQFRALWILKTIGANRTISDMWIKDRLTPDGIVVARLFLSLDQAEAVSTSDQVEKVALASDANMEQFHKDNLPVDVINSNNVRKLWKLAFITGAAVAVVGGGYYTATSGLERGPDTAIYLPLTLKIEAFIAGIPSLAGAIYLFKQMIAKNKVLSSNEGSVSLRVKGNQALGDLVKMGAWGVLKDLANNTAVDPYFAGIAARLVKDNAAEVTETPEHYLQIQREIKGITAAKWTDLMPYLINDDPYIKGRAQDRLHFFSPTLAILETLLRLSDLPLKQKEVVRAAWDQAEKTMEMVGNINRMVEDINSLKPQNLDELLSYLKNVDYGRITAIRDAVRARLKELFLARIALVEQIQKAGIAPTDVVELLKAYDAAGTVDKKEGDTFDPTGLTKVIIRSVMSKEERTKLGQMLSSTEGVRALLEEVVSKNKSGNSQAVFLRTLEELLKAKKRTKSWKLIHENLFQVVQKTLAAEALSQAIDPKLKSIAEKKGLTNPADDAGKVKGGIDLGQGDYLKVVGTDAAGMPQFDPAQLMQLQKDLRGIVPVPVGGPQPVNLRPLLGLDAHSGNDNFQVSQLDPAKVDADDAVNRG